MFSGRKKCGWCLQISGVLLLLCTVIFLTAGAPPPRDWIVDDTAFSKEIREAALAQKLDPLFVRALIFEESRFDPFARGSCGEIGLMQVLPQGAGADWVRLHRTKPLTEADLTQPELNLEIGCWYLARAVEHWKAYRNGLALALAQYNAGMKRAQKWSPESLDGEVIERIGIDSTRKYVTSILARYERYRRQK